MAKKVTKERKLITRILKAPIRILIKARDFYMKSMIICDGQLVGYGGGYMGCPTVQPTMLPKSFSVNSSKSSNHDEDYRELMKAASTRGHGNKIDLDVQRRQQRPASTTGVVNKYVTPRSYSVGGIGRIDEDKPCDFGEVMNVKADLYPRSRSHAVPSSRTRRTSIGVF